MGILNKILKYIGTAYLIYLAWKILGSLKIGNQDASAPLKFYEGIFFQFVNPKAWIICITATSLFFPREENLIVSIIFLVSLSYFVNIPCISCWALFGTGIRSLLKNSIFKKLVEWLMAILLVLTAISLLFG